MITQLTGPAVKFHTTRPKDPRGLELYVLFYNSPIIPSRGLKKTQSTGPATIFFEGVEKRTMITHHLSKSIINSINYYSYLLYINA
jgi:hypothetical protein